MTDEQRSNRPHEDNCGRTGKAGCASCKLDCACWCHKTSDEQRVKEKYPDAVASWTSRGWRILFNESPGMGVQIIGRTESAHVPESEAWADAASRLPEGESKRHDEVTADDEPEIFALLNLHRANVEASSSPEAKQAFMDTMRFLLELAKVRHAAKAATPAPEAAPQTFEEWWAYMTTGSVTLNNKFFKALATSAWNAAKASSPAVAGGESETADGANLMPDVRIIRLGLGKVISNWGVSNGVPSVFIEPVLGEVGEVGRKIEDGREPQIKADSVSAGGVILEIHDEKGLKVLVEDLWTALHKFNEKHPEPLKCSDCVLIHGKSVCTMNCGPLIKDVRGKG